MKSLKKRQLRALKGPIKWKLPDGSVIEDTWKDFVQRPWHAPYIPLYVTGNVVELVKKPE